MESLHSERFFERLASSQQLQIFLIPERNTQVPTVPNFCESENPFLHQKNHEIS